ncbi:MAG TPA: response regulator transcription factor [Thermoanaerobaculia bacterium]|jgi:two-component system invasion response regulator UvrY|nr:response regulator transcription factor [Thermoanaerobaculia bacterium]
MIRVLIADDHAIFRLGLRRALEAAPDVMVVAEAATGEETVVKAREANPGVVLLDVSMPGRGGVETAQELKRANPRLRVLMLTMHPEDQFAVLCLKLGADGYVTKDVPPEVLLEAVRKVAAGRKYVSANLAERLAADLSSTADRPPHELLSSREFEVMRKIAAGRTPGEIAAELHLSVKTVSTYRTRVLQKMNLKTNADIMHYAFRAGLES